MNRKIFDIDLLFIPILFLKIFFILNNNNFAINSEKKKQILYFFYDKFYYIILIKLFIIIIKNNKYIKKNKSFYPRHALTLQRENANLLQVHLTYINLLNFQFF